MDVASTLAEAEALAAAHVYRLHLIDHHLDGWGLDGATLAERLRPRAALITGAGVDELEALRRDAPVDEVLSKDADPAGLVAHVRRLLRLPVA